MPAMKMKSHFERPSRIDIYIDGSFFKPIHARPYPVGAFAAIVVETFPTREETWKPTGPVTSGPLTSTSVEIVAAINALKAVQLRASMRADPPKNSTQPAPHIVLHTDQQHWMEYVEKMRRGEEKPRYKPGTEKKLRYDMAKMIVDMGVEVSYTSHLKPAGDKRTTTQPRETDDPMMSYVDKLAQAEAIRQLPPLPPRKGGK